MVGPYDVVTVIRQAKSQIIGLTNMWPPLIWHAAAMRFLLLAALWIFMVSPLDERLCFVVHCPANLVAIEQHVCMRRA